MKKLLILVAAVLAGCGPTQPAQETIAKMYYVGPAAVYEFQLEDGTRCVVYSPRGGLDCNW